MKEPVLTYLITSIHFLINKCFVQTFHIRLICTFNSIICTSVTIWHVPSNHLNFL